MQEPLRLSFPNVTSCLIQDFGRYLNPELDEKLVDFIFWNWGRGNPAEGVAWVLEKIEGDYKGFCAKPEQRGSGPCLQFSKPRRTDPLPSRSCFSRVLGDMKTLR